MRLGAPALLAISLLFATAGCGEDRGPIFKRGEVARAFSAEGVDLVLSAPKGREAEYARSDVGGLIPKGSDPSNPPFLVGVYNDQHEADDVLRSEDRARIEHGLRRRRWFGLVQDPDPEIQLGNVIVFLFADVDAPRRRIHAALERLEAVR